MRAAGYIRVSSTDQVDGTSLDNQRTAIEGYCKMKGIDLVSCFQDNGVSGGKPIADRAEGGKLVEAIQAKQIDCVIVLKLDRAFRNVVDCLTSVDTWDKAGVSLHIIDLGGSSIDTSSPSGRFMLTILSAAAEMERGMIRDRCNAGRKARKAEGKRIGEIPYGYSLGANNKLLKVDAEQAVISKLKTLRSKGTSYKSCAAILNAEGITSKKGGTWAGEQVRLILSRI